MVMNTRVQIRALSQHLFKSPPRRSEQRLQYLSSKRCPARQILQPQNARLYSTPSAAETPTIPIPEQPRPQQRRSLRPYIYATLFTLVGIIAGKYVGLIVAPPALPAAGSKEDNLMVKYLKEQAEKLPIVQSLSIDPSWSSHDAYTSLPEQERPHRLTTGPLGGARAIGGFQRIFINTETGETITVVWFGGAIAGWPGVTHGGVTATIIDETLGRCAIRQFPAQTGVTANLELNYLKPILTNSFYVIRAVPEAGHTERKCWVNGRLETLDGRVCVEAKGLFVVPKGYKTRVIAGDF